MTDKFSPFEAELDFLRDQNRRKSAGYAGKDNPDPWSNFRASEVLGIQAWKGVLVRMSDKFIRVCNLAHDSDNERVGENIADTLGDLAAYALIAKILYQEASAVPVSTVVVVEEGSGTALFVGDRAEGSVTDGTTKSEEA